MTENDYIVKLSSFVARPMVMTVSAETKEHAGEKVLRVLIEDGRLEADRYQAALESDKLCAYEVNRLAF